MYYFDVLGELYRKKIRYLVVGGLAINLYGVPRVTQDIDIIVAPDKEIYKIIYLIPYVLILISKI